jgi:glycosyltransferase involved in cell wall biosynthesis
MTIYNYITESAQRSGTGVARFDKELRRVFPDLQSVTKLPEMMPDATVICDNHLSMDVLEEIKTVVCHHGVAAVHFERDPKWRTAESRRSVLLQTGMFSMPNRTYVAPSQWVAGEFAEIIAQQKVMATQFIIPHWVETIDQLPKSGKPIIIGDWRDNNKGANVWRKLVKRCPQWEFKPLAFRNDADKRKQYGEASLYLCLSLSEGGSYSMCDAEAASLPIVTTDVGNYLEFDDCEVIQWQDRDNLDIVIEAIENKLKAGRGKPSFYRDYTFDVWKAVWNSVISQCG